MVKLEVCAGNIESALNAQNAGADRIELCTELSVGGLTPSYGMIKLAKDLIDIPIYVLIRPRAGDFNYNLLELEQMKEDIMFCAQEQIDGVVIGALTSERTINERILVELMGAANYMDVTFHRAFDLVANPFEALDTLKELGVQRILTSGGNGNAIDHVDVLSELIEEADDEMIIMPGGGIRTDTVTKFLSLGVQEVHSSCLQDHQTCPDLEQIRLMKRTIALFDNEV